MSSSESDPEIEETSDAEDQSESGLSGAEAWESLGVCSELAKTCEERLKFHDSKKNFCSGLKFIFNSHAVEIRNYDFRRNHIFINSIDN